MAYLKVGSKYRTVHEGRGKRWGTIIAAEFSPKEKVMNYKVRWMDGIESFSTRFFLIKISEAEFVALELGRCL